MALTASEKQKRYRAKKRNAKVTRKRNGNAPKVTVTQDGNAPVTQADSRPEQPYQGGPDCQCQHCRNYRASGKTTAYLNHGPRLTADQLAKISPLARNRVALPGDHDYDGVALRPEYRDRWQPGTYPCIGAKA